MHANGFTLVRRVLEVEDYSGDDLLAPTRLYLDDVRRLRAAAAAFAHVTGGGILGNLARVLPEGLRAEIDVGRMGAATRLRVARTTRVPRTSSGACSTSESGISRSCATPATTS